MNGPEMLALAAIAAYLLGSIPFGLVLTRLAGYGDIRSIGSGNIGATNVLRTGNKGLAALTLLLDAGKGAVAVLVGAAFGPMVAAVAGVAAFLGHLFPVWLKFRGGKGVATAFGILAAASWPVGLALLATWIAMAALFRYSSLAALTGAVAAPFFAWALADRSTVWLALAMAVLVVARHHANIRRLLAGTESRISFGRGPAKG